MDKSLKGVLAHYGVEEVITRLKDVLEFAVMEPTGDTAAEIKEEIEQHSNDIELISSIMEAYQMQDGDGNPSTLKTATEWEFPDDKADFEAKADNIIIAKSL